MSGVPNRIEWAVSTVSALRPSSVLELGCGRGIALQRLATNLPEARLVGVDRSIAAVTTAKERNQHLVEPGRLTILHSSIAELDQVRVAGRFDVVFGVNVNVFWLEPRRELWAVAPLLLPGGRLLLFYEPPSESQGLRIARDLAARLEENGFEVTETLRVQLGAVAGVGLVATNGPRQPSGRVRGPA